MYKVFISAYKVTNTDEENRKATVLLESDLIRSTIANNYVRGKGVYNGGVEKSFCVFAEEPLEVVLVKHLVFSDYSQVSVLVVDDKGNAKLHYDDGEEESVGKLVEVSENYAKRTGIDCFIGKDGHTYTCKSSL